MGIDEKIVNLLSPIFDNRVYPDIAPQAEIQNDLQPFCVYTIFQQSPLVTSGCGKFLQKTSVQIDIYVSTNKVQVIEERNIFCNEVFNILQENGFIFKENRHSFDPDFRLYRSSSDWAY